MRKVRKILEKVYVIGTGTLAVFCAEYAKCRGMETFLYDMGRKPSAMMQKQAGAKGIAYVYESPRKVFDMLCGIREEILLVSAINEWIVPAEVLEKENITAINLHQALLPAHPGRNAEAWAIYDQDEKAGITWHRMVPDVDKGDILIRKEIPIESHTTSFSLFRKQIVCACEGFAELFAPLIQGTCTGTAQLTEQRGDFHFKKDVPNDGWLDPGWDAKKISAFLRAMDYGVLRIWDPPKIRIGKEVYRWQKYELHPLDDPKAKDSLSFLTEERNGNEIRHIRLVKPGMEILLKKCTKMEENDHGKTNGDFK